MKRLKKRITSPVELSERLRPLTAILGQSVGSHHSDRLEDTRPHVNLVVEGLVKEEERGFRRGEAG